VVYLGKEKRALDFQKFWSDLQSLGFPIVVEGKRDTLALRKLGIDADIIELNDGTSVLSTVERLFQKFGSSSEFIILTDWDKTGNKLAKQLILYGESCDLIPNDKLRLTLSKFAAKEISCVEELPTFVHGLGHKDLFL
jgi:5S rRNA maturation endonuclease (ribonuclease M5)|tara:strand:- start:1341 stop:1754 length:414 start_codon:yes stop_codon:yes gene_type:complete